jgi:hypothetical protein
MFQCFIELAIFSETREGYGRKKERIGNKNEEGIGGGLGKVRYVSFILEVRKNGK